MSDRFKSLVTRLALLLAGIVLPLYAYKVYLKTDYTDFEVYYRAAYRMKLHLWDQIYTLKDGASPFRYAPIWLPLFRPLADLSSTTARLLWYFLQYTWFSIGFFFLFRSVKVAMRSHSQEVGWVVSMAFLFILRFCLDTFTIGQVSSLLLLGLSVGLYAWMIGSPKLAGSALFFPAIFKMGPAYLYALFLSTRNRYRVQAWLMPILWLVGLGVLIQFWASRHSFDSLDLWTQWIQIVKNDSVYFDASHYGNQSIKGALLRLAKQGWLASSAVGMIHLFTALLGCGSVIAFWLCRRPRTPRGRGLFFSLGLFPYLWFMPETFKYSMTVLAIPVAFLLTSPRLAKNRLTLTALCLGFLTLSIPGKDLVGDFLFFGLQKASLPLLTTLLLCAAVLREALSESIPSHLGSTLRSLLYPPALNSWAGEQSLPLTRQDSPEISILVPLALDHRQETSCELLKKTLVQTLQYFRSEQATQWPNGFEVIVVPYGNRISKVHPNLRLIEQLAVTDFPEIKIIENSTTGSAEEWRGAVLRKAFWNSQGKILFILNPEIPCDPVFYGQAHSLVQSNYDLVRGNRRHPATRFKIPVRYLSMVYSRHRMGLFFNRLITHHLWQLPIKTTDTHSGILVLRRNLARKIFALQSRADFLFDLELALIACAHGAREMDLPIRLFLSQEKRTTTILYETLSILLGLPHLVYRYRKGYYQPFSPADSTQWLITADDWGMSPGINAGILELAKSGVVRRTSAMAESRYLQEGLLELRQLAEKKELEIGIHFNLTHEKRSPSQVFLRALGPHQKVFKREVQAEFQKQIMLLLRAGIQPTYLDGHHHIHLVPGVIEALAKDLHRHGIQSIRLPADPSLWSTSRFPLLILSWLAKSKLKKLGFQFLPCFYPRTSHFHDLGSFCSALTEKASHRPTEVIVHPASQNDLETLGIPDSYTAGRVQELQTLRLLRFIEN